MVLEVLSVVAEEGAEESAFKFKRLWVNDLDIKGPIHYVSSIEGYLLVAQGPNYGMNGICKVRPHSAA